jgi:hypothetical protein
MRIIVGYQVAQLRAIFRPALPRVHPLFGTTLAYVYWFSDLAPAAEKDILMYRVRPKKGEDNHREGEVIELQAIHRLVQLIPIHGSVINPDLSSENCIDRWHQFYINSFMDKETYQAVY